MNCAFPVPMCSSPARTMPRPSWAAERRREWSWIALLIRDAWELAFLECENWIKIRQSWLFRFRSLWIEADWGWGMCARFLYAPNT